MHENKYDIQAIEEFLANKSRYTDAEEIATYLNSNEPLLEKLIPFNTVSPVISLEEKQKQLQKIIGRKSAKVRTLQRMLAAAVIIGIIATGIFWWVQQSPSPTSKSELTAVQPIIQKNKSDNPLLILLPDGSKATLDPMAEIVYTPEFSSIRHITLIQGNVLFDIKKDSLLPFTVLARGIQTTVLGTTFWVELPQNTKKVAVKLQTGKVKIQSVDNEFAMNETFLAPGENCFIDKTMGTVKVVKEKIATSPAQKTNKQTTEEENQEVLWTNENLQFSKAGLSSVFEKLEARYHVKIIADEGIVSRSVLTGKIYHTDSLQAIIKSISDINQLSYEIRNDSVFLKKKRVE